MFQLNYPNPMSVNIPSPAPWSIGSSGGRKSTTGDFIKEIMGGLLQGMQQKKENEYRQQQMAIQKQQMAAGQQKMLMDMSEKAQDMWTDFLNRGQELDDKDKPSYLEAWREAYKQHPYAKMFYPSVFDDNEKMLSMMSSKAKKPEDLSEFEGALAEERKTRPGLTALEFRKEWTAAGREEPKDKWETREGFDVDGNPIVYRLNKDTGDTEVVPGVKPKITKGTKIYDANGNLIAEIGGVAGESPLVSKKTEGTVEESLFNAREQKARMAKIKQDFRPEFLQTKTKLDVWALNWKDKLQEFPVVGDFLAKLSPKERKLVQDATVFFQDSIENLNRYIHDLTGAQMSKPEAERLRKAVPDPGESWWKGDGPAKFEAAMNNVLEKTEWAIARYEYYLKNGLVTPEQVKTSKGYIWDDPEFSIDKFKMKIDERGLELLKGGYSEEEAERMLELEFGVKFPKRSRK